MENDDEASISNEMESDDEASTFKTTRKKFNGDILTRCLRQQCVKI